MKTKQTTCNYCALACNMDAVYDDDGQLVKMVGSPKYPVNVGHSCVKGLYLHQQTSQHNDGDLPIKRDASGQKTTIEWKAAYKEIGEKLLAIKEKYGSQAVAGISTGQLPTEEMALLGHVMRDGLGANLDGNTRLCMATSLVAYKQSFGFDAPPYTLKDLELSDTIVFVGANPVVAHPVLWMRERLNKIPDHKVIVIDPRHSETARMATDHYAIKDHTDITLFYTLAHILIENSWVDEEFIAKSVEGYEEFKEFLGPYTLEKGAQVTGLTTEQIAGLAKTIHEGKRVSFWWTMGVNQSFQAVRTAQSIINVALITGNIGKPGTGANSITGQSNAMGSRLFSNTTGLYGGAAYSDEKARKQNADAMGAPETIFPSKPTLPYDKIIAGVRDGSIKALYVVCTDPFWSFVDTKDMEDIRKNLELLVVQDLYADGRTASVADYVLPVCPGAAKDGFYINTERRLSAMRKIQNSTRPSDFEVITHIGQEIGMGKLLKNWETPESVFNILRACSKGLPCDITGIKYSDLQESAGVQWPLPEGKKLESDERRLFEDGVFYHPSGKAKLLFEEPAENPLKVSSEFPYILNTGRLSAAQWHTQSRTREIPTKTGAVPSEAPLYLCEQDAQKEGIVDGQKVTARSVTGSSAQLTAHISESVRPGQLFAPIHYAETNKLVAPVFDTYSREPAFKSTPVGLKTS